MPDTTAPEVIARSTGHCGELVLRRRGPHHEIIANGMFLMDTSAGESERLLVRAAADRMPGGSLLIGGLGVAFSLREALAHPRVTAVTVVEREPDVITWNQGPLGNAAPLQDPRTHCICADLIPWLTTTPTRFDALCLDIDNGPDWTLDDGNATLYSPEGLALLRDHLTPGGVLAIWSASTSPTFTTRLTTTFTDVETHPIPVPRGEPDVVYLAR
ncbi:spermine/spermidine synthase domain-containing protein [Actinokineospora bangkokensis]|uniref:Spermidine synthase n=1 Tax=Actinokineospora bangkokensis TaxID=1193682 RepID=A0A1Q9LES3_9PSEU|nr:spermidine synthase [Actinokineospora bangkokensis]OLR90537.1 spermidine synthase [Actinokineospora bangkokensis]